MKSRRREATAVRARRCVARGLVCRRTPDDFETVADLLADLLLARLRGEAEKRTGTTRDCNAPSPIDLAGCNSPSTRRKCNAGRADTAAHLRNGGAERGVADCATAPDAREGEQLDAPVQHDAPHPRVQPVLASDPPAGRTGKSRALIRIGTAPLALADDAAPASPRPVSGRARGHADVNGVRQFPARPPASAGLPHDEPRFGVGVTARGRSRP